MKILFCTNSLGTLGGIERVTIVKANALAEIPGNEVYIAFTDKMGYPKTVHPISVKVHIVDLDVNHWNNNYKSRIQKILCPLKKFFLHFWRLSNWVKNNNPEVIISVGQSEKYILPFLKVPVKIREVHFNSTYRFFTYKSKWKAIILNFMDFKVLSIFYDKYYLLTKQDKEENFNMNIKFSWMHNPSSFSKSLKRNTMYNRSPTVLAVGRLNYQKNFEALIRIWSETISFIDQKWCLKIIGDGPEMEKLQKLSKYYNLGDRLILYGRSNRIKEEMENASIFALTSRFEGFALVLTEALACGLPVISFDTKYGPKDIIHDSVDGFIIEGANEEMFKEKLVELIHNIDLRENFSIEAYKLIDDFDVNRISKKWMNEYMNLLLNK